MKYLEHTAGGLLREGVIKNTLTTVKCQIQLAENPPPAVVISVEAARVDNAILLDYLTSEVALKELRSEALTQTSQ